MPPNAERGEQGAYMDLARKFARGGSGVLPNGSQVAYGTEARSVCPFPDFIRFQQQQIFAVGLGRVQSGENQGDNLGGNAAGVVDSALRRIVRRDARRIARAVNDCVTRRALERLFPGRPALARFDFDTDPKRTCREALAKYRASSDHPSADDVASGKVPIETAVEKGFEATFAGHRLVFFTEDKLGVKYRIKDEPGRLKLIPEMLQKKGKMQPQPHKGEQTAFIESRSRENEGKKRLVAVADTETGVVMSVMRADNDYIGKHFRKK